LAGETFYLFYRAGKLRIYLNGREFLRKGMSGLFFPSLARSSAISCSASCGDIAARKSASIKTAGYA
jgi:hypothetical protein